MSYIDTTFERGGDVVKTVAKIYGGWDETKKSGFQFYDQQYVDYKGDIKLRVAVWMCGAWAPSRSDQNEKFDYFKVFPLDFTARFTDGKFQVSIANGRLSIVLPLRRDLPWIVTSNGKPAVDWELQPVAQYRNAVYLLRHMIVFNLHSPKRGDSKEWDLLPFLPGGLFESNRRRH
jgi:hypothetical protein